MGLRDRGRPVAGAAVADDDLGGTRQRGEVIEHGADPRRLVEDGDDHRDQRLRSEPAHSRQSGSKRYTTPAPVSAPESMCPSAAEITEAKACVERPIISTSVATGVGSSATPLA